MPYEYRKLSPKDREKVFAIRKQHGYPLHAPPHPFRDSGNYLITAANFDHVPIMEKPERRTEFQQILLKSFWEIRAGIVGWVVLPNHYHVLVNIESLDLVSRAVRLIHGKTSREWNLRDNLTGKRKVWYRFTDRAIRGEIHLNQALNYIHVNPFKHRLVDNLHDWPWSSLFLYEEEKSENWLQEHLKDYPVNDDFGKSWDD